MNERIKELIAKATTIEEHCWRASQENFDREKFAELLVKECMAVAAKQRKPANLNYNPSERFVEDLRQHFGVEE